MKWQNWSQSESCRPAEIHFARTVEDVQAAVVRSRELGLAIRVAGSGHSHHRLVPTEGVILDLSGLSGVIGVDTSAGTARVWAGSTLFSLGRPLLEAGVGLVNQGDIDRQALAGPGAQRAVAKRDDATERLPGPRQLECWRGVLGVVRLRRRVCLD